MTTPDALNIVGIAVDGVSKEALVAIVRRLQAENERLRENAKTISELGRLRKDAERIDWLSHQDFDALCLGLAIDAAHCGEYYVCGDNNVEGYGGTFREAIDAARGEQ